MPSSTPGADSSSTMYARAVDDAAAHLRELRHEEWAGFALAALAIGLSLAATQVRPALALPLFLGGVVVGILGTRAFWRRWALLDQLADERDAYVIPDVVAYASRETTMDRRRDLRCRSFAPPCESLESAASSVYEPPRAISTHLPWSSRTRSSHSTPHAPWRALRLLSDPALSPLINPVLPPEDLRSRVFQIRAGFSRRRRAA